MWDVILDSLLDTLKIVPILYLVYLLVSYLGHNTNNKYTKIMQNTRKFGPLIGGTLGCVPQCGFSVVMADLYSQKAITIGTLIAVMLATSDEAIPIMLSNPEHIVEMLILIGVKLVIAIFFGYLVDISLKLFRKKQEVIPNVFEAQHNHDCVSFPLQSVPSITISFPFIFNLKKVYEIYLDKSINIQPKT